VLFAPGVPDRIQRRIEGALVRTGHRTLPYQLPTDTDKALLRRLLRRADRRLLARWDQQFITGPQLDAAFMMSPERIRLRAAWVAGAVRRLELSPMSYAGWIPEVAPDALNDLAWALMQDIIADTSGADPRIDQRITDLIALADAAARSAPVSSSPATCPAIISATPMPSTRSRRRGRDCPARCRAAPNDRLGRGR
jgi:hypothetical protein